MNRESISFEVTDERPANGLVTLKVIHRLGIGGKVTSIDWYTRKDGKWARAGLSAGPDSFLSDDWSAVPDQLLLAMGVQL